MPRPPPHAISELSGVEIARENTRRRIAFIAVGSFFVILGISTFAGLFGWLYLDIQVDELVQILTTAAAVLSGVAGAAIGFYFRGEE